MWVKNILKIINFIVLLTSYDIPQVTSHKSDRVIISKVETHYIELMFFSKSVIKYDSNNLILHI